MNYIKFCPVCAHICTCPYILNDDELKEEYETNICKECGSKLETTDISLDEYYDKYNLNEQTLNHPEEFNIEYSIKVFDEIYKKYIKPMGLLDPELDEFQERESTPRQYTPTPKPNQPHCPTCGSTNIKPITGVERTASILTLGIFSKKINKSYKCNKCGATW